MTLKDRILAEMTIDRANERELILMDLVKEHPEWNNPADREKIRLLYERFKQEEIEKLIKEKK